MKAFKIDKTDSTPYVECTKEGKILLKGRSFPEDVQIFYQPLLDWAETVSADALTVDIDLDYINSGSSKVLLQFLRILDTSSNIGKLTVIWRYEEDDEDTLESGEIYEDNLINTDFMYYGYRSAA
jgi:hypothetical protein